MGVKSPESILRHDAKSGARLKYMGRNPDKYSRTGREVLERMRSEGLIKGNGPLLRGNPNNLSIKTFDGSWVTIGYECTQASLFTESGHSHTIICQECDS